MILFLPKASPLYNPHPLTAITVTTFMRPRVHLHTEYLTDKNDIKIGGKLWEDTLSGDFKIDENIMFCCNGGVICL